MLNSRSIDTLHDSPLQLHSAMSNSPLGSPGPLCDSCHTRGLLENAEYYCNVLLPLKAFASQAKAPRLTLRLSAVKCSAGKGTNQQPQQQKKRKLSETEATAGAESGSQPEAAGREAAAAADRAGQLWEAAPIRWGGGKQKRKHVRLGSADGPCGLPGQACRAPQQTPFGPDTAVADCPAAAATTAAAGAGAPGIQYDKTR